MKKFLLLICIIFISGHICVFGSDKAIRTDITAEIDNTPIETYNINGFTYVPVDVLENYGFNVEYNENKIIITRIRYATPLLTKELWEESIREKTCVDIIGDNITVYLDGSPANSVVTSDGVLMMFDEFQKYGNIDWNDKSRHMSISIFANELKDDYDNAQNIKELILDREVIKQIYKVVYSDKANYKGQVNENNVPHGIGKYEFSFDYTKITLLGYFKDGKPHGPIIRNMTRSVVKSYSQRISTFIGTVNSEKDLPITNKSGYIYINGPNFGIMGIPGHFIDEWTSPEIIDPNPYNEGCYFESYSIKNSNYHLQTWKKGELQTVVEENYPEYGQLERLRESNSKITNITEFSEYQNGNKTYYNGGVQTISDDTDSYGSVALNRSSDGAGFYAFTIKIILNGDYINMYDSPQIVNDRVMIPCRSLFENLDATVEWNETDRSVTVRKDDKIIRLHIDSNIMTVNGNEIEIDTSAMIINDRTFVPVRVISEAIGARVDWDENTKSVIITD